MHQPKRRIIGLTGGIATGKTTVSDYLHQKYQIPILDADVYAKEAVQPNSAILKRIFERYGESVQLSDGQLNRQGLGDIIFNNPTEKQWLESQIHPYVRQQFQDKLTQIHSSILVFSIPLLFEANLTHLVTEIWVVYCSYEQQIQRLIKRNQLTQEQAISRIKNQLPLAEKMAQADVVLDNSSTLEKLYQQIDYSLKNIVNS